MGTDAATCLAVQAVMRWRRGHEFPIRKDFGRYRALLYELFLCLVEFQDETPAIRAVYLEEIWSIIGAWPRFNELAKAVQAFEERVDYATSL